MMARAIAAWALLFLLSATRAAAQQGEDPRREQARQLLAQGEREFDARAFLAAERTFRRLRELMTEMGNPRAFMSRYNEGRAAEEAGFHARAADSYQQWLDEGGRNEPNAAEVEARIRDLRERAAAGGGIGGGISPIGPIVISVGGAALVAGFIVGGVALSEGDKVSAACPTLRDCDESIRDRYERMRLLAGAADVLWISGAVIAAVGVVLLFTLPSDAPAVSAACGPNGCRLSLTGAF